MIPSEIEELPAKIISLAAGDEHVMALDITGKIYSWGSNKYG